MLQSLAYSTAIEPCALTRGQITWSSSGSCAPWAHVATSTVERWDTAETVDRIETQIGRDLQFIRINGTVVGGLAGLVIYSLSRLL